MEILKKYKKARQWELVIGRTRKDDIDLYYTNGLKHHKVIVSEDLNNIKYPDITMDKRFIAYIEKNNSSLFLDLYNHRASYTTGEKRGQDATDKK